MAFIENSQLRLKHVDNALTTMRAAGYVLDKDAISLVWKAASGEATQDEITTWTAKIVAGLNDRSVNAKTCEYFDGIAIQVSNMVQNCKQQLEEVCSQIKINETAKS